MNKIELRNFFKQKYGDQTLKQIELKSSLIYDYFINCSAINFSVFHVFLSAFHEVQTGKIISSLLHMNKIVVVPRICGQREMKHVRINYRSKFIKNRFGIREPLAGHIYDINDIDVVLVPLLGVDYSGNRIGYGGGYYDVFFNKCNKKILKIGLGFFEIYNKKFPVEPHDISMNLYISPKGITKFS